MLNKQQQHAFTEIVTLIQRPYNKENSIIVLTGGPGTGKTYLLNSILNGIDQLGFGLIIAAAPSNSALTVMQSAIGTHDITMVTVAKLLGIKMKKDGTNEFTEGGPSSKRLFNRQVVRLFIVDEISMLNDELSDKLIALAHEQRAIMLVVGDRRQLPPVGQHHDSKLFNYPTVSLTKSERFGENIDFLVSGVAKQIDLINNEDSFDPYIISSLTNRESSYDKGGSYKFVSNIHDVLDEAVQEFAKDLTNRNNARIIAYKNNTIKIVNNHIRQKLSGMQKPPPFLENELMISTKNYLYRRNGPVIYNGQVLIVESFAQRVDDYGIPILSLKFAKFTLPAFTEVKVIDPFNPDAILLWTAKSNELEQNALKDPRQWSIFYKFKENYAEFDYAYSTNVYKAQGQSINNVFVFEKEILDVKPLTEKQKLQALYVSLTRVRKDLTIYNKDY